MTRDENPNRKFRNGGPARTVKRPQPAQVSESGSDDKEGRQRIAKLMARVGLCSRRDAESWVLAGRVSLNGTILTSPAVDVGPQDQVLVDGVPLPVAEKTRLFLFHKPGGLITTDHDPEGRPTVSDYLRDHWTDGPRVVTVGRLDFNTEGLLLLTNDGGLARVLELPRTGWVRRYRVRAKGETNQAVLDRLFHGVTVEGIEYAGIEAKLDRIQGANCWLTVGLREGKNREVKRVLEHIGLEVNRLIRLSFGPFQLLDLPEGAVEEVKTRVLRDQLGPSLAALAGVDFNEAEPAAKIVPPPEPRRAERPARPRQDRDSRESRGARKEDTARPHRGEERSTAPRQRQSRDRDEAAAPPEKRERPVAGPRRHVSTLRAASAAATQTGPRKRVERTATTDHKHRSVAVERIVSQAPEARRDESGRRDKRGSAAKPGFARDERLSQSAQGKRERVARSGGAREERPVRRSERPFGDVKSSGARNGEPRSRTRAPGKKPSFDKPSGGRSFAGRSGKGAPAAEDRSDARTKRSRPEFSSSKSKVRSSGERPARSGGDRRGSSGKGAPPSRQGPSGRSGGTRPPRPPRS